MGRRHGRKLLAAATVLGALAGCRSPLPSASLAPPVAAKSAAPPPAAGAPQPARDLPGEEAARICITTAEGMERAGQDAQAITFYLKARQHSPQVDAPVARRLAVLYDRTEDFTRSQQEYQRALQAYPKDADLLNDLGYSYYCRGRWDEAEKSFRKALALSPKHHRAWINLGMNFGMQGNYEAALDAFGRVVTPAQAQSNLAFIYTTQGKRLEASASYRKALELEPELRIAQLALDKLEKPAAPAAAPKPQTPAAPPAPVGGGFALGTVQFTVQGGNVSDN